MSKIEPSQPIVSTKTTMLLFILDERMESKFNTFLIPGKGSEKLCCVLKDPISPLSRKYAKFN